MRVIITLIPLMILFSCNDEKKQNIAVKEDNSQKKIQLFYKSISKDSIEVRVEYTSALDTIDTSNKNERFTFLYWTRENISTEEMEEIIENDDKQRMKEENLVGYNMGDKRTIVFNYKFIPEEKNYLIVLVEDLAFIDDYNESEDTRIIQNISTIKVRVFPPYHD